MSYEKTYDDVRKEAIAEFGSEILEFLGTLNGRSNLTAGNVMAEVGRFCKAYMEVYGCGV